MADPRETARAWLAERIWADGMGPVMGPEDLADAILRGAEVDTEYGVLVDGVFTPRPSADDAAFEVEFCNKADGRSRTVAQRVVIRLPAQPIGETT